MIFTVYCGTLFYMVDNGAGRHITDFYHLQLLTKWVVVAEATYVTTMMVSILFTNQICGKC